MAMLDRAPLVERNKEYVQAARVVGLSRFAMRRHLLPKVLGPVLVLATINLPTAIVTEPRCRSLASACRRPGTRWAR
jgi:ABC-type dipeptide/oligopeptide/nickel transport system permease subunit